MEKIAAAFEAAGNNKWDFISVTKFPAFERQVRNALSNNDLLEVTQNDEPTVELIKSANTSITDASEIEKLHTVACAEYRTADKAAHGLIDKLLVWNKAPARLTQMNEIEKRIGYPSGRALWLLVEKCRDKSSYQDQRAIKNELRECKVSAGCDEEGLRSGLNEIYGLWVLVKGNSIDEPDELFQTALSALPIDSDPELKAYVGSVRALMHASAKGPIWDSWDEFLDVLVEQYKALGCCGKAKSETHLALADTTPRVPRTKSSTSNGRGACGLCRAAICPQKNGGKDKSACATFNHDLEVKGDATASAKRFLHSGRAHVSQNPDIKDMSDVRFRFLSTKKAIECYSNKKGAKGTNAAIVEVPTPLDDAEIDAFWDRLDEYDEDACQMLEGLSEDGVDIMHTPVHIAPQPLSPRHNPKPPSDGIKILFFQILNF